MTVYWGNVRGGSGPVALSTEQETAERRVKAKLWKDRAEATHSNETRAMELVHNQLARCRNIRVLA
ncbi:hypothetical protein NBRC116594_35660 [Shimia sp. NS0008-38b]